MAEPTIIWDHGTAYDLFISLHVLHNPDRLGLRGAWAAGVRSRLPIAEREFLQDVMEFLLLPLGWIHQLAHPKDTQTALKTLAAVPVAERLATIDLNPTDRHGYNAIFRRVAEQKQWKADDKKALELILDKVFDNRQSSQERKRRNEATSSELDWWTRA